MDLVTLRLIGPVGRALAIVLSNYLSCLLILALGFAWIRIFTRRGRWLAPIGLGGLFWLHWSQWPLHVTRVSGDYWFGEPWLEVDDPGNPSPETRLREQPNWGCCVCVRERSRWVNGTVMWHWRHLGPAPQTYQGPYPDRYLAATIMRVRGEAPKLQGGDTLVLETGERFPILRTQPDARKIWVQLFPGLEWGYPDRLSDLHFREHAVIRVAFLGDRSILAETAGGISIWVWGLDDLGEMWAEWPK